MKKITVLDLLDLDLKEHNSLNLRCIGSRRGLVRELSSSELNRPGLALSGFYDRFANNRIQVFGRGESAYLEKLWKEGRVENIEKLFSYDLPCCVFTHEIEPVPGFLELAEENGCPVLQSDLPSSDFSSRIIRALNNVFAPKKLMHGVMLEVFGIGVFILGDSGVGKSETALELIERGHRLVADDAVEIKCVSGNILLGSGTNALLGHHMEIRGLGIINIAHIYGVGAIRDKKQVQLIVELEEWEASTVYDRLGNEGDSMEILGVKIPYLRIPVKPGRNIPIIIETAAMNERLKKLGYYSAREFNQKVVRWLESESAKTIYMKNNDKKNQDVT